MASEFKSEDVERALQDLLTAKLPGVDVDKIVSNNLDADGNLIATPPAVRVLYDGSTDQPLPGVSRRDYNVDHAWLVFCGARNLRSKDDEDTDTKTLLSTVRSLLAGVRLTLADGDITEPIALGGSALYQFDANGTWYSQRIIVSDVAQFSGGAA